MSPHETYETLWEMLRDDVKYLHLTPAQRSDSVLQYLYMQQLQCEVTLDQCVSEILTSESRRYVIAPHEHERASYGVPFLDRLDCEEQLTVWCEGKSATFQCVLLFCCLYPDDSSIFVTSSELSVMERLFLLECLQYLYPTLYRSLPDGVHMPVTSTERFLFLDGLSTNYPVCAVLLDMLQDPRRLMQFLMLFGSSTITLPSLQEYFTYLEEWKYRSGDQSSTLLDTDVSFDDPTLKKTLAEYLEACYTLLVTRYDQYLLRLIETATPGDINTLMKVYHFFQQEMQSQFALLAMIPHPSSSQSIREPLQEQQCNTQIPQPLEAQEQTQTQTQKLRTTRQVRNLRMSPAKRKTK